MKTSSRTFTAIGTGVLLWLCLFAPSQQALADNANVSVGHDATLAAGKQTDNLVSVFGSSTSDGDVTENVVSVFGDTRVTGTVGENAVAVLGDTYVNSPVKGDVVAVLGDVNLGPLADIGGDLVSVGGTITRDPAAVSHGQIENITLGHINFKGLRSWFTHCLILGRPLAFAPDLGWAWILAGAVLALYLLFAVLFPAPMERCVRTFEQHPGHSALTALISILLTPVVIALLVVTVVGIIAIPFVWLSLWIACLFGKAVMLAWIGRRFVKRAEGPQGHPALAVLVGGVVVALLSVVPVLGFLVFMLLGFLGLGTVLYTLILERREARASRPKPQRAPQPSVAVQPMVSDTLTADAGFAADAGATADATAAEAGASAAAADNFAAPPAAPVAPPLELDLPLAGFWIRMAALAIDLVLIGLVVHLVLGQSGNFGHRTFLILLAVYGAVMWKLRGTTIGGIVCKLRVQRVDGMPLDWENSIVRALGCFVSLAIAGLGFIWIAFDDQKQSWHDKFAGTVVVQTEHQESLVRPAA